MSARPGRVCEEAAHMGDAAASHGEEMKPINQTTPLNYDEMQQEDSRTVDADA